jgi:hypothetical protein
MRWTTEKVEELRSLAASGQSKGRIAKRFGVSSQAVPLSRPSKYSCLQAPKSPVYAPSLSTPLPT